MSRQSYAKATASSSNKTLRPSSPLPHLAPLQGIFSGRRQLGVNLSRDHRLVAPSSAPVQRPPRPHLFRGSPAQLAALELEVGLPPPMMGGGVHHPQNVTMPTPAHNGVPHAATVTSLSAPTSPTIAGLQLQLAEVMPDYSFPDR